TEGREQLAIKAFAEALEAIPVTIAQNAGIDPIDIMVELRQKHNTPANKWYGVNVYEGKTADMWKMNVIEPLRVKKQVIKSAVEERDIVQMLRLREESSLRLSLQHAQALMFYPFCRAGG